MEVQLFEKKEIAGRWLIQRERLHFQGSIENVVL